MVEDDWLEGLIRDATRYRLVFLHLGAAFVPLRGVLKSIDAMQIEASEFCQSESLGQDENALVVIDGVDRLRGSRRDSLGQLRERVISLADRNRSVVLVSSVAKDCYEQAVGSDIIADSRQHFVSVSVPEVDSLSCLPGRLESGGDDSFLRACLEEIGFGALESVSQRLWEYSKSPMEAIDDLDPVAIQSLRGAGLIAIDGGKLKWTTNSAWKRFRLAVAEVASARVVPAVGLGDTFVDLWVLERAIRNRLRRELQDKRGSGWRSACIPAGLQSEVLERARKDAHPGADRVGELRDPLEWLSTSELLDLRETLKLGDLGMESYLWSKLRATIVPLRNRVSHMRLVDENDRREVATWKAIVVRKLA